MKKPNQLRRASEPTTTPDELRVLAKSKQREIRLALLRNPNTPADLLLWLAPLSLQDFIENPVVPLLFIERPDLLAQTSPITIKELGCFPALPEWMVPSFATIPLVVKVFLARQANTHPAVLTILSQSTELDLCKDLAAHSDITTQALENLASSLHDEVRRRVASHPRTAPTILLRLAADQDATVRVNVVQNPRASKETLAALLGDAASHVRAAVVANPSAAELLQLSHARDASLQVRLSIAKSTKDAQLLLFLSRDKEPDVRMYVARNPHLPAQTLARLSVDPTPYVVQAAAKNPNATTEILQTIANGAAAHFSRLALATHPKTPKRVLQALSKDKNHLVQEAAFKNLNEAH